MAAKSRTAKVLELLGARELQRAEFIERAESTVAVLRRRNLQAEAECVERLLLHFQTRESAAAPLQDSTTEREAAAAAYAKRFRRGRSYDSLSAYAKADFIAGWESAVAVMFEGGALETRSSDLASQTATLRRFFFHWAESHLYEVRAFNGSGRYLWVWRNEQFCVGNDLMEYDYHVQENGPPIGTAALKAYREPQRLAEALLQGAIAQAARHP